MVRKYGQPADSAGTPTRLAALAFGKLGGDELNYSSDIDLLFVYDVDGETTGRRGAGTPNSEFFNRTVTEVIRLLSADTDRGIAYRVDLRLRPDGHRGPLAKSLASTLSYYDVMGRTWERQALIKLRPVAGDIDLGRQFVKAVEPFVYRKYFSFSEINEVKALKRRMEARTNRAGNDDLDVKTGLGGIRDIEFAVQFLQLLNGGDLSAVRQRNTLLALEALEIAGCLTPEETFRLSDAYRFLRKTEHRLQLLFDWQTHRLPTDSDELRKLARRMGYRERVNETEVEAQTLSDAERGPGEQPSLAPQRRSPLDEPPAGPAFETKTLLFDPLDLFLKDYNDKTKLDRAILDHLLHQTFAGDGGEGSAEPESDLILDPDPDPQTVAAVLGKYPFRDVHAAYQNLTRLAQEAVPFLSGRRCRHFLANIAPQLLRTLADTPDPDEALNNLERVTASLGAKAVLYELFSFNPPCLRLYVDICANSPYLSAILTNNPGMIDELLDSLELDQPRSDEDLRAELAELCRGASDPDPILHSFQDKELLRIGVQDLLGKEGVRHTTSSLSSVADTVLNAVFDLTEAGIRERFGPPPCRYAVLGLGKLGGREISYHSDLDLSLVYETDDTDCEHANSNPQTSHQHYFTDLLQRVIKMASTQGPMGRLYTVDMRLRPTGKSGSLVMPLSQFRRYYSAGGGAQMWERQALTRARVARGQQTFADEVQQAVHEAILGVPWQPEMADTIREMRAKLESTAGPRSLKRGRGGVTDVEFLAQLLQIKYGRQQPTILTPNLWDALNAIEAAGLLSKEETTILRDGYSFLRFVEARLRIVTDRPLTELPDDDAARLKLARRVGFDDLTRFDAELGLIKAANRQVFLAVHARERVAT